MSTTRRGVNPIKSNGRNPSDKIYNKPENERQIPIMGKTIRTPPKLITPIVRYFLPFKVFTGLNMKYE